MTTNRSVTKKSIVSAIHKRFGKKLKKRIIHDAIDEICAMLQNDLIDDKAISVHNFGTLSPFLFHRHSGMNVASGELRLLEPFRTVKFRPHAVFLSLLAVRRTFFLVKKSTK